VSAPTLANGADAVLDCLRARGLPTLGCRSRVLEASGDERLVMECSFGGAETGPDVPSFVAKCYADDTGARTFEVMRDLAAALPALPQAPTLALPEALCYDAQRRCLVQQRVPGLPLREMVNDPAAAVWFARAGRALAELHRLPLPAVPPRYLRNHFGDLVRPYPTELARALPRHGNRILALVAEMEGLEWYWLEEIVPAPVHRDFHMRQAFCHQDRVWVIDWDLFCRADPMLDLGNFLMVLETRAAQRQEVLAEAFLGGYFGGRSQAGRRRIPLYMALNFLRRACKHYRLRAAGWQEDVERMLARAEQCLANV
jgi:aminoglycoside phosphotransferase (APT) family kinase protein